MFAQRITDADAEASEVQVWIDFAADCGYLPRDRAEELRRGYEEIGKVLGSILKNPARYKPNR
jgi:four helix bundle protein